MMTAMKLAAVAVCVVAAKRILFSNSNHSIRLPGDKA